ncbi:cell wall hydrolase [Lachnospiraceae bacterium HCP1S3_A10]
MTREDLKIASVFLLLIVSMLAGYGYLEYSTTPVPESVRQQESIEIEEHVLKVYNNMVTATDTCSNEPVPVPVEEVETEPQQQDTSEDMELLLRCVEAEAGNQSLEGRRMVADVILNRARDSDFPDTIEEVIKEPYRFSSYWDGRMWEVEVSELTREAVEMELEEVAYPGLFYFTAEGYSRYGTPWKKIGDHYFSTK